jgi:hypothetical protein
MKKSTRRVELAESSRSDLNLALVALLCKATVASRCCSRGGFMESITSLGVFLIPIVAILVGGAIAIAKMITNHQERIAMIERGIHPDAPNAPRQN